MMRHSTITALAVIGLLLSQSAGADIQSAMDSYQAREYDKAFTQFQELAQIGNPQAQYALAVMYLRGEGTSANQLLGYGWLKLAAEQGHAKAAELLPKVRADMVEESVGAAERLVSRFAPSALNERLMPKILPDCEFSGMTRPKVKEAEAPRWPQEALSAGLEGNVIVELTVGADGAVRDSRIVRSFPLEVFDATVLRTTQTWLFEPAIKDGHPTQTVMTMGVSFMMKHSSMSLARTKWFTDIKQQAESGDAAAQYAYAMVLSGDPEFHQPWGNVLEWIEKSAKGGYPAAQYQLGESLLRGRGCEADPGKAVEWLRLAAQADDTDAQVSLARVLLQAGPTFDSQKALFWLSRASEHKNRRANKYLASILAASTDESVRDPVRALKLMDHLEMGDGGDPTSMEIRASALAAQSKYTFAVRSESAAIKRARELHRDTSPMNARLQAYENNQPWFGELISF